MVKKWFSKGCKATTQKQMCRKANEEMILMGVNTIVLDHPKQTIHFQYSHLGPLSPRDMTLVLSNPNNNNKKPSSLSPKAGAPFSFQML